MIVHDEDDLLVSSSSAYCTSTTCTYSQYAATPVPVVEWRRGVEWLRRRILEIMSGFILCIVHTYGFSRIFDDVFVEVKLESSDFISIVKS